MGSPHQGATQEISAPGLSGSEDADLERSRQEHWATAEATYGLSRPGSNEDAVYVHRQTTERFAIAPDSWDQKPVGHDAFPAEILEDIAMLYLDIRDQWRVLTWWLCRVHRSSTLSAQPTLGYTNYVLVLENDFENFGRRPHGLIELVCGDDSFLFPTCLPEWLNWPLLQVFLEPITHRDHFGIGMMGFCNGDRLSQRLQWILCAGSLRLLLVFLERTVAECTYAGQYPSHGGGES